MIEDGQRGMYTRREKVVQKGDILQLGLIDSYCNYCYQIFTSKKGDCNHRHLPTYYQLFHNTRGMKIILVTGLSIETKIKEVPIP